MPAPGERRPAVFLDRDGTLIHDCHYLADPTGVELLPGAAAAVARLNRAGFFVVLATNQSGIGRGYFSEANYRAVHARLVALLAAEGAHLDADYHCPLSPDALDPDEMRKPGAGMFRLAAREHGLDLARSWLVGDRVRDVAPAAVLGARAILVHSPQTEPDHARAAAFAPLVASLADAVDLIVESESGADAARNTPRHAS
jgi:histidinol-phosphate phosphatase family protein